MTIITLMCKVVEFVFIILGILVIRKGQPVLTCSVVALIILFSMSVLHVNMIKKTEYTLTSSKLNRNYKILFMSDLHYGSIQSKSTVHKLIDILNKDTYDFIILGGDIIEEETSRDEVIDLFKEISTIHNRYGIYYVYGNHDLQSCFLFGIKYDKNFVEEILRQYRITSLCDSSYCINNDICIVGRNDANSSRHSINELYELVDKDCYLINVDHQPIDVNNVSNLFDLQLSGHTHAGQIFPLGMIMRNKGLYTYGYYKNNELSLIVSSGVGVGGVPVRTEKSCEYVVVNLNSVE